jgi:hypothetical protein
MPLFPILLDKTMRASILNLRAVVTQHIPPPHPYPPGCTGARTPGRGSEPVTDTLEVLLYGSRVAQESDSHLAASGGNITLSSKDIVGDPLDKVCRILVFGHSASARRPPSLTSCHGRWWQPGMVR